MADMEEEEPEKFQAHFKNYIDNDIEADEEVLEEMYSGVCSSVLTVAPYTLDLPCCHSIPCTCPKLRIYALF